MPTSPGTLRSPLSELSVRHGLILITAVALFPWVFLTLPFLCAGVAALWTYEECE